MVIQEIMNDMLANPFFGGERNIFSANNIKNELLGIVCFNCEIVF